MTEPPTGYFVLDGDRFVPRPEACSPWSTDMLHGRLLGGLAARQIERDHGDDELVPARLTVDLFRSPPMEPVSVETDRVRDGRRIRVVDAVLSCGDEAVARATVVLLRRGAHPEGEVWSAPDWSMPPPEELPPPEGVLTGRLEMRTRTGQWMRTAGQKQVWLRDHGTLLDGEPLTALTRAAVASDFASPLANSGEQGLAYINADISLYLARPVRGEWVGFEVGDHVSDAGIAVARCRLYDIEGPVGFSDVCAVANRPMAPRR